MTFIDVLREARSSPVAVLHEFWTQFDPTRSRVHAFFEGGDDVTFYRRFLNQRLDSTIRLYTYRCKGKAQVYETFKEIIKRHPSIKGVIFFVDKDIDDILGTPWPTDPRIYVTDVYSIENYLVSKKILLEFFRSSIQVTDVEFQTQALINQFDTQLSRFYLVVLPLMAWIVSMRRAGLRLNLTNVNLTEMFEMTNDCRIRIRRGRAMEHLYQATGVVRKPVTRRLLQTSRELRRIEAKRFVRGKFEAWFFVEFWKHLVRQLRMLAKEGHGNLHERIQLERSNFVPVLSGLVEIPQSLDLFLGQHLTVQSPRTVGTIVLNPDSMWSKLLRMLRKIF